MIQDQNKGITSITYNHLNLPTQVSVNGTNAEGVAQQGTISYIYDATGVKLQKIVSDANSTFPIPVTTSYAGGYIYEGSILPEKLKMFPHLEGYVEPVQAALTISLFNTVTNTASDKEFNYAFNFTDHLGNVRLTYSDSDGDGYVQQSEIISEKNYYPFGLQQKGYNNNVSANVNSTADSFGYGGKELNDELGLNWYDITARNYDAALGRWMNIDPLAELMRRHSPYNYAFDNPIVFTDPDGMAPWKPNGDGTYTAQAGDSAATLAEDAGISFEEANAIVQDQLGENYVDPSDGVEKSDVEVGDVVAIPEQVEAFESEQATIAENERLDGEIDNISDEINSSIATKDKLENDIDSLQNEWIKIDEDPALQKENYGGEPGSGLMIRRILKQTPIELNQRKKRKQVDSVDEVIKKQKGKKDSLKSVRDN